MSDQQERGHAVFPLRPGRAAESAPSLTRLISTVPVGKARRLVRHRRELFLAQRISSQRPTSFPHLFRAAGLTRHPQKHVLASELKLPLLTRIPGHPRRKCTKDFQDQERKCK